jgi:hypothetical protein
LYLLSFLYYSHNKEEVEILRVIMVLPDVREPI